MMTEIKKISWQLLRGNKFIRSLHPAMLLIGGCKKSMITTPTGSTQQEYYEVQYDRDYVIAWMAARVVKPLETMGFDTIQTLLLAAWELRHPDTEPPKISEARSGCDGK